MPAEGAAGSGIVSPSGHCLPREVGAGWPLVRATPVGPGGSQLGTFDLPFSSLSRDGVPFMVSFVAGRQAAAGWLQFCGGQAAIFCGGQAGIL